MSSKANKIRERRKALTYSVREISNLTDIPVKSILDYESGKKIAKRTTIEKIANATKTHVSDWVDDDYFRKRSLKGVEKQSECEIPLLRKSDNEIASCFIKALLNADDVMDVLLDVLIDMKEIKLINNDSIVLSQFSEKLCKSIFTIKLKKVLDIHNNRNIGDSLKNKSIKSIERASYDNLLYELKHIFKDTDCVEAIIQALIDIGHIDNEGLCTEKADALLKTLISYKIKKLTNN